GLLERYVEVDHRHRFIAKAPGCGEALMPADDGLVFAPSQHGLDEPILTQALGQGFELSLRDPSRVRRVRAKLVDGYLDRLVRPPRYVFSCHRAPPFSGIRKARSLSWLHRSNRSGFYTAVFASLHFVSLAGKRFCKSSHGVARSVRDTSMAVSTMSLV